MLGPHRLLPLLLLAPLALAACSPSYSPDDYATRAVQQMNRVEQGTIVGRRQVVVTAEGTTGAATGAAAGGIIGAQSPGGNMASAIGGVGGALIGGLLGTATERVAGDTTATEYIVRKENGDLLSVVQRDQVALAVGERVLVIAGAQARIVPDYTRPLPGSEAAPTATAAAPAAGATPAGGAPAATAETAAAAAGQPAGAAQADNAAGSDGPAAAAMQAGSGAQDEQPAGAAPAPGGPPPARPSDPIL